MPTSDCNAISVVTLPRLLAVLAAVVVPLLARAEMAPGFPASAHGWLHELYAPGPNGVGRGEHCCTAADCWLITYRIAAGVPEDMSGYQVFFRGEWLNVPADRVLRRSDNPTGNAVLCIQASTLHIYCFVPGGEG